MIRKKPTEQIAVELAVHFRQLRLDKGWTREELAERTGINLYTLKHFERSGQISLERFLKLCDEFELVSMVIRACKPRKRVNISNWEVPDKPQRQRGRRRDRISGETDAREGAADLSIEDLLIIRDTE